MPDVKNNRIINVVTRMTKRAKITFISIFIMAFVGCVSYYFFYGKIEYVPLYTNISMKEAGNIVTKLDELKILDYKIENNGTTILVSKDEINRIRIELAVEGLTPNIGVGYEIFDEASFAITDEDRKIMYQRALEGELARSIMSLEEIKYARVHLALSEDSLFSRETASGNATVIIELNPLREFLPSHVKGIVALVSSAIANLPPENISVIDTNANLLSSDLFDVDNALTTGQSAIESIAIKHQFEAELESELQFMLEKTYGKGKVVINVDAKLNLNSEEITIIEYDENGVLKNQQDYIEKISNGDINTNGMSPIDNNIEYYPTSTEDAQKDPAIRNYEINRNYEVGETRTYKIKAPGEVLSLSTAIIFDGRLNEDEIKSIKNVVSAAIGIDETRGDFISVEGIPFDRTVENTMIEEFELAELDYMENLNKSKKYSLYKNIAIILAAIVVSILFVVKLFQNLKGNDEQFYESLQPIPVNELVGGNLMKIKPFEEQDIEKGIKTYAEENPAKLADLVKAWMLNDEG